MTDALHTALTEQTQEILALRRALEDIVAFATHRLRQVEAAAPRPRPTNIMEMR